MVLNNIFSSELGGIVNDIWQDFESDNSKSLVGAKGCSGGVQGHEIWALYSRRFYEKQSVFHEVYFAVKTAYAMFLLFLNLCPFTWHSTTFQGVKTKQEKSLSL